MLNCNETDTISISYIGYRTKKVTINEIKNSSIVYLKEDNMLLNNITVYGNTTDPEIIVQEILKNKKNNYLNKLSKKQILHRGRYISHVNKINFKYHKSNFSNLGRLLTSNKAFVGLLIIT